MPLDPDDEAAIRLDFALRDLWRACHKLADPEAGMRSWFEMVFAVLLHGQAVGRPLSWIMLLCARRTISDIEASL